MPVVAFNTVDEMHKYLSDNSYKLVANSKESGTGRFKYENSENILTHSRNVGLDKVRYGGVQVVIRSKKDWVTGEEM